MDGSVAEQHWDVREWELESEQENQSHDGEEGDATQWIQVFDRWSSGIQDIEDLQVRESLENDEEHFAFVSQIVKFVILSD